MFLMDLIIHSLMKMMYLLPISRCKSQNTFSFFIVYIFAQICSTVSGSMGLVYLENFVIVGALWRVEPGVY